MTRNLTTSEVADILRVSVETVRDYVQTGRLGHHRTGGDHGPLTFKPSHVEAFLASTEHHPNPDRSRPAKAAPTNVVPLVRPQRGKKRTQTA